MSANMNYKLFDDPRRWVPTRRGAIYCSKNCGGDCTWAEHQTAQDRAKALCKTLGPGWAPRIWENLGWHFSVHKGQCVVHPNYAYGAKQGQRMLRGYTAFFNTQPQAMGEHPTDPLEAVLMAIEQSQARIDIAAQDIAVLLS